MSLLAATYTLAIMAMNISPAKTSTATAAGGDKPGDSGGFDDNDIPFAQFEKGSVA